MRYCAFVVASVGLAAGVASADPLGSVSMKYVGGGQTRGVTYTFQDSSNSARQGTYATGSLVHQVSSSNATGAGQFIGPGPIDMFCIELEEHTRSSYRTFEVRDLSDAPNPSSTGPGRSTFSQQAVDRILAAPTALGGELRLAIGWR